MDVFGWISMLGGLAMFLYGMHVMGEGLSSSSSGRFSGLMTKSTSNPIKGVAFGAGLTAIIQSSSATTVMVVGFVNSGLLLLDQAASVIMGANIGTTVTSWILSLTGLSGDNPIVTIFKPSTFAPLMAIVGVILVLFLKKEKQRKIGTILFGLGLLLIGMEFMSSSVQPLAQDPSFTKVLTVFSNPILGVLAGLILTAAIQSSSASVGILQALILTGTVPFSSVLPIIMGQNIGTCVTAIISSIGTNKNARRAALIHLYFNVIGTVLFMIVFYSINAFYPFAFLNEPATAMGVAIFHTCFNLGTTLVLLPNRKFLVKLACWTVREKETDADRADAEFEQNLSGINDIFLNQPAVAINQAYEVSIKMGETARQSVYDAIDLLDNYSEDKAAKISMMEDQVDKYEDRLGTFLLKLSSKELSANESDTLGFLLHAIADYERISDHAENIMQSAKEIYEKKEVFDPVIKEELVMLCNAVEEILQMTQNVLENKDVEGAKKVEPLEEVIGDITLQLRERRVHYLSSGTCTMLTSFILSDLNVYLERIAAHCSNIAVCLIESSKKGIEFDIHEYVNELRANETPEYKADFKEFRKKYKLPDNDKLPKGIRGSKHNHTEQKVIEESTENKETT